MSAPSLSSNLPPLNALRAFEAAGRLRSITEAAASLDVTPGAVSRQVRLLETANWLVPRLADFRRRNSWTDLQVVASSRRADFAHPDVEVEIAGYDTCYIDQHLERTDDDRPRRPARRVGAHRPQRAGLHVQSGVPVATQPWPRRPPRPRHGIAILPRVVFAADVAAGRDWILEQATQG